MLGWGRGESQDPAWQRVPTPFRGSRGEMRGSPRLSLGHGQVFSSARPPKWLAPDKNRQPRVSRDAPSSGLRGLVLPKSTRPDACARRGGGSSLSSAPSRPEATWTGVPVPTVTATAGPAVMTGVMLKAPGREQLPPREDLGGSPGRPLPDRATATCLKARLPREPPVRRSGVYFAKKNQMRGS